MATPYRSQVQNVYYQGTSGGRPSTPKTNELIEISNALNNFYEDFKGAGKAYINVKRNKAQAVFDTLKAQNITDPEKIKKLIEEKDPRVADLQSQYASAVINMNFGVSHALEDSNRIQTEVFNRIGDGSSGLTLADVNMDEVFSTIERDFSGMDISYTRAYTETLDKIKVGFAERKSVADAERLELNKRSAYHTQIVEAWEMGSSVEEKIGFVESLFTVKTDKSKEGFLKPQQANATLLNFLEERSEIVTDPTELNAIVKYLTMARDKVPSFMDTMVHQEQATRIMKNLITTRSTLFKNNLAVEAIMNGEGHKDIYKDQKITEQMRKEASNIIMNNIVSLVAEEAIEYHKNTPPSLRKFDTEARVFNYMASIYSKNSIVVPQWKETLEHGLGVLNNSNVFDADQVKGFSDGYRLFKKLKAVGQVDSPNPIADYLSGRNEVFYEGVDTLVNVGGMEIDQAVQKMWQIVNAPTKIREWENLDEEMRDDIAGMFSFWISQDVEQFEEQAQEAVRIMKIFRLTGSSPEDAKEKATKIVQNSYVVVDGILWNRRNMPMGVNVSRDITEKSIVLAEQIAKKSDGLYNKNDLVLAPWYGGFYIMMNRFDKTPVNINGKAVAFTQHEVFGTGGKLSEMMKGLEIAKILEDNNERLIKILSDKEIEDLMIKHRKELEKITTFDEDKFRKNKNE